MTHTYNISGMTCANCQASVKKMLSSVPGVTGVDVDLAKGEAIISMSKHVETPTLQQALQSHPKYQLSEKMVSMTPAADEEPEKTWFQVYKPILLIFFYITASTILIELVSGNFDGMRWMHHFMAAFFLVFSFFKLLDLEGFADSYTTYDIIAKRWRGWAYVYPFVELALGFAYLAGFVIITTSLITLIVMSVSIVGVLQSVFNKRKIRCACLGAVFNVPMSTVTIIEDGLMIVMSGWMLSVLL